MDRSDEGSVAQANSIRRVGLAGFAGTTMEWYDYFLYGAATALIFNQLYFPTVDPLIGTLEFVGDGAQVLSVTERGTICNMITELGATAAVFSADERVREWLIAQAREQDFVAQAPDPDANHDETEIIELSELEPLIAKPSSPASVRSYSPAVRSSTCAKG